MNESTKKNLTNMIDALISGNTDAAKQAFHGYVVEKSAAIVEGDCCDAVATDAGKDPKQAKSAADVVATKDKAAKAEIKASGEAKSDPKAAKSAADVVATKDKAAKAEIKKSGEAKDDPKQAKSAADVVATKDKAAKAEIK